MISSHGYDVIKAIGVGLTALGFVVGGLKWIITVFKKLTKINSTIELLATNHLPHIQSSLDAHTEALQGIKKDVAVLGTRMENHETRLGDTRGELKIVHASFLKHLEESAKKRKK